MYIQVYFVGQHCFYCQSFWLQSVRSDIWNVAKKIVFEQDSKNRGNKVIRRQTASVMDSDGKETGKLEKSRRQTERKSQQGEACQKSSKMSRLQRRGRKGSKRVQAAVSPSLIAWITCLASPVRRLPSWQCSF